MKQHICVTLGSIHLLGLAICTYIAAIEIQTIEATGLICSIAGVALGISAIKCRRPILAAAGFSTPIMAVTLLVLEAFFLKLGPNRAALPFCIVFIVNQVIATLTILIQLNIVFAPPGVRRKQITIKTLLVCMASFSVFMTIAKSLLVREHDWMMALALGLLGLTFVGLTVALYTAFTNRDKARIAT
jgi:hypothetical protein